MSSPPSSPKPPPKAPPKAPPPQDPQSPNGSSPNRPPPSQPPPKQPPPNQPPSSPPSSPPKQPPPSQPPSSQPPSNETPPSQPNQPPPNQPPANQPSQPPSQPPPKQPSQPPPSQPPPSQPPASQPPPSQSNQPPPSEPAPSQAPVNQPPPNQAPANQPSQPPSQPPPKQPSQPPPSQPPPSQPPASQPPPSQSNQPPPSEPAPSQAPVNQPPPNQAPASQPPPKQPSQPPPSQPPPSEPAPPPSEQPQQSASSSAVNQVKTILFGEEDACPFENEQKVTFVVRVKNTDLSALVQRNGVKRVAEAVRADVWSALQRHVDLYGVWTIMIMAEGPLQVKGAVRVDQHNQQSVQVSLTDYLRKQSALRGAIQAYSSIVGSSSSNYYVHREECYVNGGPLEAQISTRSGFREGLTTPDKRFFVHNAEAQPSFLEPAPPGGWGPKDLLLGEFIPPPPKENVSTFTHRALAPHYVPEYVPPPVMYLRHDPYEEQNYTSHTPPRASPPPRLDNYSVRPTGIQTPSNPESRPGATYYDNRYNSYSSPVHRVYQY